jgi:hypothetical protein
VADATFEQARRRFEAARNHQNGDSPIDDSAEAQRTAQAPGAQPEQPPKIGADLENIAAALAEAKKTTFLFFLSYARDAGRALDLRISRASAP